MQFPVPVLALNVKTMGFLPNRRCGLLLYSVVWKMAKRGNGESAWDYLGISLSGLGLGLGSASYEI